jgi:hypothetical protein
MDFNFNLNGRKIVGAPDENHNIDNHVGSGQYLMANQGAVRRGLSHPHNRRM